MTQNCQTCFFAEKNQLVCRLSGLPIDLTKDGCSHHRREVDYCEICRKPMLPQGTITECDKNGEFHHFCGQCNVFLLSCKSCGNNSICLFETDPNPMPKVVMKVVQQGNMRMQAQVKNEEREKLLCVKCDCWNEEYGCMKEFNIGCTKKTDFWTSRNP